jgi:tight adherence protein C
MVISLLAALAVFLTVVLMATWVVGGASSPLDTRARALALGRRPANIAETPFSQRVLLPIVEGFTRHVMEMLPQAFVLRVDKRLTAAGKPTSVQAFFIAVLTLGVLLPVTLFVLLWTGSQGAPTGATLLLVPLAAAFGAALPFVWLSRRAQARQLSIWKSLPGAFDLITTCVEAGLGLDAAFQRVAEKLQGPFTDEVRQMLLEVEMGRPRREALEDLANRTGVPELVAFVNAVIQAQQLGTNLGRVLRAQAHQMRVKRRQRAEETARRMPVKMVFPLVFCMMPSLFIIILGPLAVNAIKVFSDV